jgi:hypothetical protein
VGNNKEWKTRFKKTGNRRRANEINGVTKDRGMRGGRSLMGQFAECAAVFGFDDGMRVERFDGGKANKPGEGQQGNVSSHLSHTGLLWI